jgi:hypothetical protein
LLGALGLTKFCEWLFMNVLTPIGDIVNVLNWMSKVNTLNPFELLISCLILIIPTIISAKIIVIIRDKVSSIMK